MASSGASISLGSNFYVSPKTGGVSVMQTRKGAVSSQVKLTFTVLTGVLRIVARHLDKVMGRLDFDDHVPLSDEYHLAVVGSTFDGEETRVGANAAVAAATLVGFLVSRFFRVVHRGHPPPETSRRPRTSPLDQVGREPAPSVLAAPDQTLRARRRG